LYNKPPRTRVYHTSSYYAYYALVCIVRAYVNVGADDRQTINNEY